MNFRSRPRWMALVGTMTIFVGVILAHEGHAPLPSKGLEIDRAKGRVTLTAAARAALDLTTTDLGPPPPPSTISAYATIVPAWTKQMAVSSRLPGRLVKIAVRPGDSVAANAVVVEIESSELLALQSEWLTIHNSIRQAEQLVKSLEASGTAIAGQALLDAQSQLHQTENLRTVARARWQALGLPAGELERLLTNEAKLNARFAITAPIGGVVTDLPQPIGQNVEPGQPVLTITDLSKVWIKIGILETDLESIAIGQSCELRFPAIPNEVFEVAIQQIGLALDPETRLGTAWAEIANPVGPAPRFVPGMFAVARIALPNNQSTKSIPAGALVDNGVDRFVFVEGSATKGTSEFFRRNVEVIRTTRNLAEIRSNEIVPGDRVVARGSHQLGSYFAPDVLKLTPTMFRNLGVRVEPASVQPVDSIIEVGGRIELPPDRRGLASSAMAGVLQRLFVDREQVISSGEVVAEIFSSDLINLELELVKEQLSGNLLAQQLKDARSSGGAVPKKRLIELEAAAEDSRLRRKLLRRRLGLFGLSPDQLTALEERNLITPLLPVRSNQPGAIVHFETMLGRGVKADQTIFTVHDARHVWVQALVPENELVYLNTSQRVRVRLAGQTSRFFAGHLVRRSPEVTAYRSGVVWIELDGTPNPPPRHDQLAQVVVVIASNPPTLAVPLDAVTREGRQAFVFVRKDDGSFDRRPVELGRADDLRVEVVAGLQAGEPIAVTGAAALQTAYASVR